MKNLKKFMALLVAMIMVVAMAVPAMAEVATDGKITINSPIVGAKYYAYKVFDLEMNDAQDAFSYTIAKDSPFYDAVVEYANATDDADGLTLTGIASDANTFSVTATNAFDAQAFGTFLKDKIDDGVITATAINPTYAEGDSVTVASAKAISFENLAYGYYLILNEYPAQDTTVKVVDADGTEYTVDKNTTQERKNEIAAACADKATDSAEEIQAYIDANGLKNDDGSDIEEGSDKWNEIKQELYDTTYEDALAKIEAALKNKQEGSASDDNTLTQRMVFVDSTTPTATINEKNEVHKWDVPVNPTGYADVEDLPEHGEPKGGKNIIVGYADEEKTKPIYADWTEANIGDKIHYQLSINATNYERDSEGNVKQIKEYILADYENQNMEFSADDGLMVSIVKKEADGTVKAIEGPTDYVAWKDQFFKNDNDVDVTDDTVVLSKTDSGLVISWIEQITEDEAKTRANVTKNVVNRTDSNGHVVYKTAPDDAAEGTFVVENSVRYLIDKAGNKIPETDTYYYASKYENDVTILVDYYMTVKNTAVIDGDGNKNVSQYGVNYITPSDKTYEPTEPDTPEDRKPTEIKDKDDAVVYTYALALHKVDQDENDLAGAKFKAKGLTVTKVADGHYKVKKYDSTSEEFGDEMATDSKGLLVIEGLATSATMTIRETEAPEGYNKLASDITANAKDLNKKVTTTETVTKYDADGNVISDETEATTTVTVVSTIDELKAAAFTVENNKGTELPATGGIGTTLFYIVGAILVIGAGIVLITRRRMSAR